jgi:hypothetical protein
MLTEEQREVFTAILDSNWETKELQERGEWHSALEKSKELNSHIKKLKEMMGENEYANFIEMGKMMFAPKV